MENNFENWNEFFYIQEKKQIYEKSLVSNKLFLDMIAKIAQKENNYTKILETGCGSGYGSIYLSKLGYKVTGLDLDKKVVEFAKNNNKILQGEAKFLTGDLKNIEIETDIIFSNGVLEHFKKPELEKIFKHHFEKSKYIIFFVPNDRAETKTYGDENHYSDKEWKELIEQNGGKLLKTIGWGAKGKLGYVYETLKRLNLAKYFNPIWRRISPDYVFIAKRCKR
jgi:SAM-dependent methyltransferase